MNKREELIEILADILDVEVEEIDVAKELNDYDEWDSLAHVQVVAAIIEDLDIDLSIEETTEFVTIGDFLKVVGK